MNPDVPQILYVEDDESLSFVTKDNLELQGYAVTHHADGKKALKDATHKAFDLMILDVMLPGVDGFTIAEEVRKVDSEVPILFLTAKSLKEDRIHGLKLGGDDYITKPYSIEELILRVEVFLKRKKLFKPKEIEDVYAIGKLVLDYRNLLLQNGEEKSPMTQREADLLRYLAIHKNNVLKRGDILKEIWGEDDYFLGRSLDVFISRLRKYLKDDPTLAIENIHGVGFKLVDESI
ncbi:MAG: response regulator transcription factor [Lewinellaceae bacterium]|nr:response regulator transcription factor [Saprospiraceae bacterium]MCB9312758.1 response regulator transcription factor [Lewinellaceae bacterium]HRW74604.1 response regulator transcription factor [Saprospiraceae bacterium]